MLAGTGSLKEQVLYCFLERMKVWMESDLPLLMEALMFTRYRFHGGTSLVLFPVKTDMFSSTPVGKFAVVAGIEYPLWSANWLQF